MKIKYAVVSTNSLFDGGPKQIDYTYARFDGLLAAETWLSDVMDASVELNSLKCYWYQSAKDTQKFLEIETKLQHATQAYKKKFGYDILEQDTEFRIIKVYTFN